METTWMSLERVLKAIMSLGLTETDAQVYIFLSLNGPHKVKDMTNKLSLYKEQLYHSLKNLRDKDVVKATTGYPALFSAIPFDEILDLLTEIKKEQAQALQEVREELLSSWKNMIKKNSKTS
jgi:sugar-specific transcriptional regulator TrmB